MSEEPPSIGRRPLLAAALLTGAAGLVGCVPNRSVAPTVPSPAAVRLTAVSGVDDLLALDTFVVAHRGSGDNWPEHTLAAYHAALHAGVHAVEISVRATVDGQLVCHHDADFARTSGSRARVDKTMFAYLPKVDARRWLGPATELEPIPLLTDVLAALPSTTLAFVEDKDGTNTGALLEVLDAQPRAQDRFVWKQWGIANQVSAARGRGYRAWGYFGQDDLGRISELADSFDCLGVGVDASDDALRLATGQGKPVMAWAVHTRSQAARLASRGVQGLMCSNVPYVVGTPRPATIDGFDTGRRSAGDLPRGASDSWQHQPELVGPDLRFTEQSASSYLLGSLCPLPSQCELTVRLGWPGHPKGTVGIAFGLPDDADYEAGSSKNSAGAHRVGLTSGGRLTVWDDPAGAAPRRVQLPGSSAAATNGSALLQLWLSDTEWSVRLGTGTEVRVPRRYGGDYLWVWTDSPASGASVTGLRIG